MIVYDAPTPTGNKRTRLTEEEAIWQSKAYATTYGYVYPNDHEALIDFIVIHWAWQE